MSPLAASICCFRSLRVLSCSLADILVQLGWLALEIWSSSRPSIASYLALVDGRKGKRKQLHTRKCLSILLSQLFIKKHLAYVYTVSYLAEMLGKGNSWQIDTRHLYSSVVELKQHHCENERHEWSTMNILESREYELLCPDAIIGRENLHDIPTWIIVPCFNFISVQFHDIFFTLSKNTIYDWCVCCDTLADWCVCCDTVRQQPIESRLTHLPTILTCSWGVFF